MMRFPTDLEADLKAVSPDNNDAFDDYYLNQDNWEKRWFNKAWAVPFVTGKRYALRFGNYLDFYDMTMNLSEIWQPGDSTVYLYSKHVDVREQINFYAVDKGNR